MAAAPGEVPTDLDTTSVLPPAAKRNKNNGSYLQTSSSTVPPAMATAADWCSLPDDLIRRVADCFLHTNDVDYYMDFRAVCHSWRSATDDPRSSASNASFYPWEWIVLDDKVFQSDDDGRRTLLNTYTGRFLHKKLPLLLDYYVVTTTSGGFFVLADKSPPHTACLFNPITGAMIRFTAPVPPEVWVANIGFQENSLLLALLGDSSRKIYLAFRNNEVFTSQDYHQEVYNLFRKAFIGGAYSHIYGQADRAGVELYHLLRSFHFDPAKVFSSDYRRDSNDFRCFLVGGLTDLVLVLKTPRFLFVFQMNSNIDKLMPMTSIGRFAIFIGHKRCLPVDADMFPGIEANCVYYTEHLGSSAHICKYNMKDTKVERISEAAEFMKQDNQFVLVADRPFTITQLLCSYTINIPDSQLALALQQKL